jgi:hypothetical protein
MPRWKQDALPPGGHPKRRVGPSSKAHIVEALSYASFIALLVSRTRQRNLRLKMGPLGSRCPMERWATVFRTVPGDPLAILLYPPAEAEAIARRVLPMIRREAVDPNASRTHLLERAAGLKPA